METDAHPIATPGALSFSWRRGAGVVGMAHGQTNPPRPMSGRVNKRRFYGAVILGASLALLVVVLRGPLTEFVVGAALRRAGAGDIKFTVTRVSPWSVELENLSFQVRTQGFAAARVSLKRAHWWTPSLGAVRVEQVRIPLNIDGSDTNPWAWSTYKGSPDGQSMPLPLEHLSLEGQLTLQAAALKDQSLVVKIDVEQGKVGVWQGSATVDGTGLKLRADGNFDPTKMATTFKLQELSLELKPWQDFIQRLVLLPGGKLELAGLITASAEGRFSGKQLAATGMVRLHEGRVKNELRAVTAEGVEADLEFTDFDKVLTKPGTLRVRELRTGQLVIRDLDAEFAFAGPTQVNVSRASLHALGGSLAAEPFKYFLNLRELEAVLLVDGVNVKDVLALTQDLPAQATGQVNGRLPVRIDGSGLRLGTGWLALKPGVYAEVQFNATGLLTGGMNAKSPSYSVLKKIEGGLLKLKLGEMRLDIRPLDAPAGRSARLHLSGEPVDPEVKAPVTLDLNVNGPIEKLLNLGLDSRVSFGAKP